MPYMMVEENGKTAVYKAGSDGKPMGKRLGLHDSKAKAEKQMSAIYANEKALGEKALDASFELAVKDMYPMMKMEPSDPRVQYNPMGASGNQGCATCQFFCAHEASCALIWDDVVATGKCNLWLGKPTPKQPEPIPVVIVEPPEMDMGSEEAKPETGKKEGILDWLKRTFGKKADEPLTGTGFKALPGNKWVSFYTNNFEDKAGEIFTEAAHDQYISWLDQGVIPYPELWYWHLPGTKHGQAEWIDRVGHVMIAAGSFDDTPMADVFRKEYETHPHNTSHTFGYPKDARQDGVYHAYFTVEISPLPVGKEANWFTPFMEVKAMASEEKKSALVQMFGKEWAENILKNGEELSKEIEAKTDLKFKEAETIPVVDPTAREALKELAVANKAYQDATLKALNDLTALVTKQAETITQLQTFVKEQMSDAPRATTSQQTVVPPTDPAAAMLAAKAADPNAAMQGKSVFENIVGMALKQATTETNQ